MYHALDLGVSAEAFWEMSPRAVVALQREMIRSHQQQKKPPEQKEKRLSYIPR